MINIKHLLAGTLALAATFSLASCKDDSEPDGPQASTITGLYINEVCSGGGKDWIELYNATDKAITLTGAHIQDNKGAEKQYTFPEGSVIAPKGFLVVEEETDFSFGIGGSGDELHLLDASYAPIDEVIVPAMDDYYTYYRTTDGGSQWATEYGGTRGRSNTDTPDDPQAGEQPAPAPAGEGYTAIRLNEINGNDKFVELYNTADTAVTLDGVYLMKDDEDRYDLPAGTVVPAHGYVTLWSAKAEGEHALTFSFGLSADKSLKLELLGPDGTQLDVFENLSQGSGAVWGEKDAKYDCKDLGSFARLTDGTGPWYILSATADGSNDGATQASPDEIK